MLITVFLSYHISAQNPRPQNLCRDAYEKGSMFAIDPSNCGRYLFCQETGVTHTLSCASQNAAFPFFSLNGCIETGTHCTPVSMLCPPHGDMDVMVGLIFY